MIGGMDSIPMSSTKLRLAQMMTPNDANVLGKVFGGSILALIDLTASSVSSKFAGVVCVTAAFDRVDFLEPVEIGELIELDGIVSFVGRTSVEVTIDVHATRLTSHERRHVNTARVTMVAIEDGKPKVVPRLTCETDEEKKRFLAGRLRREVRAARVAQMNQLVDLIQRCDSAGLDSLMAEKDSLVDALGRLQS